MGDTKIKICGLTNLADALKAEELGADFVGFIFFKNSPRYLEDKKIREITKSLKGKAKKVGLFYNQDLSVIKNSAQMCGLDVIQLHGDESPEHADELKKSFAVIKSFKIKKDFDFSILGNYKNADYFLFDTFKEGTPGGTGLVFDWNLIKGKKFSRPIFLAGGLKPGNVKKAVIELKPFCVDVASGVEKSPGVKDYKLLEEFINEAR